MAAESDSAWEVADWHKSTKSGSHGCVEVARVAGQIAIRDSKDRSGSILLFTLSEWNAFIAGIIAGEFDL
jgi:Domain of unknown function (DUF397)